VEEGTNQLIGTGFDSILAASLSVISGYKKNGHVPDLWDGKTAQRIAGILIDKLNIR
jgi:UDP-N-acetylglucosamine 2-epimerase (non-hydrolysing)